MTELMGRGMKVAFVQNEFSGGGMDRPTLVDQQSGQVFANFIEFAEGRLHLLYQQIDSHIKQLPGCICCSVKNDFVNALDKLVSMRQFHYIILECSGLADPG
jgi:G3E family GTPase